MNNSRKQRQKELNEKYPAAHFFKIGDVIYSSWGYDQTNIDFYQVVRVTKRKIYFKELNQKGYENGFMTALVEPIKNSFKNDEIYQSTVNAHNSEKCYLTGRYYMTKYDGEPKRASYYA